MTDNEIQADDDTPTVRTVGRVFTEDGDMIIIDHLYSPDIAPCDDCGSPCTDTGRVGLMIDSGDHCVLMSPEQALLLANRLQRAAGLVLETSEDVPDFSREVARLQAGPDQD